VTALACTSNNRRLVSGGGEGQVRVWDVTRKGITSMKEAMKEHKGKITCIKITASNEEV
jgi:WD40 repeat protein